VDCRFAASYTTQCTDGTSVVDIYTYDEDPAVFGQTDGGTAAVPWACHPTGDAAKMCHFRYILNCESSAIDETKAEVRRLGTRSTK
jgi:hypothetical protein